RSPVLGRNEPAGLAGADDLARAAMVGGDDGAAHRLRLGHDAAEAFGSRRGRDNDIRQHVGGRNVAAIIDDLEDALEATSYDGGEELAATARLAGADQHAAQILAPELRHGVDEHELPFPARKAPNQHDDGDAVGQSPLPRQLDDALGADALGIETC